MENNQKKYFPIFNMCKNQSSTSARRDDEQKRAQFSVLNPLLSQDKRDGNAEANPDNRKQVVASKEKANRKHFI